MRRSYLMMIYVGLAVIVAAMVLMQMSGFYIFNVELWRRAIVGVLSQPLEMINGMSDPNQGTLISELMLAIGGVMIVLGGVLWWSLFVIFARVSGIIHRVKYGVGEKRGHRNDKRNDISKIEQDAAETASEKEEEKALLKEARRLEKEAKAEEKRQRAEDRRREKEWNKANRVDKEGMFGVSALTGKIKMLLSRKPKEQEEMKRQFSMPKLGSGLKDVAINLEGKEYGKKAVGVTKNMGGAIFHGLSWVKVKIEKFKEAQAEKAANRPAKKSKKGSTGPVEQIAPAVSARELFEAWEQRLKTSGGKDLSLVDDAKHIVEIITNEEKEAIMADDTWNGLQRFRLLNAWAQMTMEMTEKRLKSEGHGSSEEDPTLMAAIADVEQNGIDGSGEIGGDEREIDLETQDLDTLSLASQYLFDTGELEEKKEELGDDEIINDLDDIMGEIKALGSPDDEDPVLQEDEEKRDVGFEEPFDGEIERDIENEAEKPKLEEFEGQDDVINKILHEHDEREKHDAEEDMIEAEVEDTFASLNGEEEAGEVLKNDVAPVEEQDDKNQDEEEVTSEGEEENDDQIKGKNLTASEDFNLENSGMIIDDWIQAGIKLGRERDTTAQNIIQKVENSGNMRNLGMQHVVIGFKERYSEKIERLVVILRYVPKGDWQFLFDEKGPRVVDEFGNYVEVSPEMMGSKKIKESKLVIHFYGEGVIQGEPGVFLDGRVWTNRVLNAGELHTMLNVGIL